jgi:AraC-like DNA-binding protein
MNIEAPRISTFEWPAGGTLAPWVSAFVGVEIAGRGPIPLAIAPHDAWMLTVQLGRGADGAEAKRSLGRNTTLTGVRRWTGAFHGAGECVTLFAMLTPQGVVELLQSRRLEASPRIRAALHELLDERFTIALEDEIVGAAGLQGKVIAFARALERRAERPRRQDRAALRAATAAAMLARQPAAAVDEAAAGVHVSRRQLERDFVRWLGTTPRHWSRVARVRALPLRVQAGEGLADAAAALGFADQAHMSNVVKQLTGLPPSRYVNAGATPLGAAFRRATRGGVVYL